MSRKKKILQCWTRSLSITMCIVLLSITIFAATVTSQVYHSNLYGYNYTTKSSATTTPGVGTCTVQALSNIVSSPSVPIGYMGIQTFLYNSNGVLEASSPIKYNPVMTNALTATCSISVSNATYYYCASGTAWLWNGSSYISVTAGTTPYIAPSFISKSGEEEYNSHKQPVLTKTMKKADYPVNQSGLAYGPALYAETYEDIPDLIAAVGTNGISGYLYSEELFSVGAISSPEEVIVLMPTSYTIPLYEKEGKTVIGAFVVSMQE